MITLDDLLRTTEGDLIVKFVRATPRRRGRPRGSTKRLLTGDVKLAADAPQLLRLVWEAKRLVHRGQDPAPTLARTAAIGRVSVERPTLCCLDRDGRWSAKLAPAA